MAHSYHETRVGAHRIISVVLMPSPFSPQLDQITKMSEKVSSESFSIQREYLLGAEYMNGKHAEGKEVVGASEKYAIRPYHVHIFPRALMDGKHATSMDGGPANFEAMAHTYSIALLFTRSKMFPTGIFPHEPLFGSRRRFATISQEVSFHFGITHAYILSQTTVTTR